MKKDLAKTESLTLAVIITVAAAVTLVRLFFGVNLTDESVHLAIPYRFALGDKPFIDEVNLIQTAFFLTYPFVKAYYWLTGGIEGIILFTRLLYFTFTIGVALVIYRALRPHFEALVSASVALVIVVLIPQGLPNLTYNTLSFGFFTLGAFLLFPGKRNTPDFTFFLAGLFHGLTLIALPTYIVPVALFFLCLRFLHPGLKRQSYAYYFFGLLVIGFAFLPLYLSIGKATLTFAGNYNGGAKGAIAKIFRVSGDLISAIPPTALISVGALLFLGRISQGTRKKLSLALLLIALAGLIRSRNAFSSLYYTFTLGTLAPWLYFLQRQNPLAKRLFLGLWVPSFIASFVTAWTSTGMSLNAGFGFFTGTLVSVILAIRLIYPEKHRWLFGITIVVILIVYQIAPYAEDSIKELNARVPSGPFRGLYTSKTKLQFLENLQSDLNQIVKNDTKVLFYPLFPAGYLLTKARPLASSVWAIPCLPKKYPDCEAEFRHDLERAEKSHRVLVHVSSLYYHRRFTETWPRGEVDRWIESHYNKAISRPEYEIFE